MLGTVLATLSLAGCGESFLSPPPPELTALPETTRITPAKTIEFIIAGQRTPDRENWIPTAMQESGRVKAIVLVDRPEPNDPPAKQAELIRKAISRGVDAMVIEPMDDPEVVKALGEVHAKGIPLVLIGRKIAMEPSGESGQDTKPAPVGTIHFAPFEPAARTLARSIVKDARASGIPGDAHALIVVNKAFGDAANEQIALLTQAVQEAGFGPVLAVPFAGDYNNGRDALVAAMEADPKAQILLTHEDEGIAAILDAYAKVKEKRVLTLAGVMAIDRKENASVIAQCAAVIDRNGRTLIRQAIQMGLRLAEGGGGESASDPSLEMVVPLHVYGNSVDALPAVKTTPPAEKPAQPKP